jgi:hypothetical protein
MSSWLIALRHHDEHAFAWQGWCCMHRCMKSGPEHNPTTAIIDNPDNGMLP